MNIWGDRSAFRESGKCENDDSGFLTIGINDMFTLQLWP